MDSLFGMPQRSTVKANLGAIMEGYVNIAVHGHSPLLVSEIVKQGKSSNLYSWLRKKEPLEYSFMEYAVRDFQQCIAMEVLFLCLMQLVQSWF